jgi:hypothetical protein
MLLSAFQGRIRTRNIRLLAGKHVLLANPSFLKPSMMPMEDPNTAVL